jgi:hypothetical protein
LVDKSEEAVKMSFEPALILVTVVGLLAGIFPRQVGDILAGEVFEGVG